MRVGSCRNQTAERLPPPAAHRESIPDVLNTAYRPARSANTNGNRDAAIAVHPHTGSPRRVHYRLVATLTDETRYPAAELVAF